MIKITDFCKFIKMIKYSTGCRGSISQIVQSSVVLHQHSDRAHIGDVQRCILMIIFVSANYVIVDI